MKVNDCDICGGAGKIRLPVRQRLSVTASKNDTPTSMPIREYACPECGPQIPQENIMICQAEEWVDGDIKEDEYIDHCKQSIAHRIAQGLYTNSMISFAKNTKAKQEYSWRNDYCLRGKLGVISPRLVATFEERVKEHQSMIAREVIDEAIKQIRNWGSEYKMPDISKDMVVRFMLESLNKVK